MLHRIHGAMCEASGNSQLKLVAARLKEMSTSAHSNLDAYWSDTCASRMSAVDLNDAGDCYLSPRPIKKHKGYAPVSCPARFRNTSHTRKSH